MISLNERVYLVGWDSGIKDIFNYRFIYFSYYKNKEKFLEVLRILVKVKFYKVYR